MADSSQKFIARNRAPRVQIEYDVELYGAEKKVQLPFVMGVLSDLSGKSTAETPAVSDRKFLEIDVDNFDQRMKAMAPRVAFAVPNTLTGEGNLAVDLTFEKMADFSPAQIAAKIEPLRQLLDARTQLSTLMAYMDGKAGAEALIEKILADPALLGTLASSAVPETDTQATLDALSAAAPEDPAPDDTSVQDALSSLPDVVEPEDAQDQAGDVLSDLAASAPDDAPADTSVADALSSIPEVETAQPEDMSAGILSDLADAAPETAEPDTTADDILSAMPEVEPTEEDDASGSILSDLADAAPDEADDDTALDDALSSLPDAEDSTETDDSADILSDLADTAPVPEEADSTLDDALASIPEATEAEEEDHADVLNELAEAAPTEDTDADSGLDDLLGDLADMAPEEADEEDTTDDALASLPDLETDDEDDGSDDILTDLADAAPDDAPDESSELDDLLGDLADMTPEDEDDADNTDDVLSDLADVTSDEPADESSDLDDLLGELADMSPEDSVEDDATDDILAAMPEPDSAEAEDGSDDILDDLITTPSDDDDSEDEAMDDILGDLTADDEPAEAGSETDASDDVDLGDLLADDDASDVESTGDDVDLDDIDLDDLLGDETASDDAADGAEAELADIDLDDLLGGTDTDSADAAEESSADDLDLDDLLSDDSASDDAADDGLADLDLDDALGDLDLDADDDAATDDDAADDLDLDDLFADSDSDGGDLDLDDAGDSDDQSNDEDGAQPAGDAQLAFGRISADRPDPERLKRTRFRIAIFGDFSGRAARGQLETGDALAARKPILLDPDTVEDVIQSFATTLVLPIGKDGAGIEVKLGELDDLHPDELYENVELFDGLSGLKGQLSSGATADHAAKQLMSWGEEFGQAVVPPRKTSGGNTVRADLKLSDFQKLIGDTEAELAQASPVDDLLKRIVGPHIHKLPSPDVSAMQTAVDEALSAAMRTVLHHPEFQSVEAQWRSLDLIARSVEDDDTLDVILYDVSAEEIAADLAAEEDLAKTGLVRLLTEEPLDEENGRGGYSALVGLYTFEETPPHAELLGRIGRVAAHVDAPFISAITPAYLDIKKEDRHPLVVKAWDTLRAMPEAGHVALASPRFLLRRPYGAKSEPIYEFDFEEFTETEGLRGMLWANPAVLVTILLARSFKQNGKAMKLGSVMSLGGVPYHYVNDRYGDQVALPCTERNITLEKHEHSVQRGYMPVLSVKGRDEIRLGSFNSVAGREILGPWSGIPVPEPSPDVPPAPDDDPEDTSTDDDLDLDLDLDSDDSGDLDFDLDDDDLDLDLGDDDSGGLDDFLAGFGDDSEDEEDDEEMDPELAALLADL